ncbi:MULTISPECIES: class E sortase [unclassified Nocardioides]|uniref:class E sortase n=1 Tax=unclassified Nocardioides TaxID=2615069 RepID=UPI0009EB066D|nr:MULTISPECIES: class E sortase [unclassified Nocardioides]
MDLTLTSLHRTTRMGIGAVAVIASALAVAPAVPASADTSAAATKAVPSDGTPRDARLTIRAVGIHRLPVIAYRGKTDDAPGTRIQNRGIAAASNGPQGGTGPGGIGNYQVAAHRTSHGGVFRHTPSLHRGDKVIVDVRRWRYVYVVKKTRWVSFRSAKSLRAQRAEVPGHPGQKATRAYITISTCATPEDHARGNYWTDSLGNPEHRIDKVGVLVARLPNPFWKPQQR